MIYSPKSLHPIEELPIQMSMHKPEASFPMYDFPETREANDRFWEVLKVSMKEKGIDAPERLTRTDNNMKLWTSPNLLVSQTCGYPYRKILSDKVQLIGTPDLKIRTLAPGYFHSLLVVRKEKDGLASSGETLAFNDKYSQSGWVAPNIYARARHIVFAGHVETGGHWYSAKAVVMGMATLAAIDVFSWELIKRFASFSDELKIIDTTEPTPGLPLITSKRHIVTDIYYAMVKTIENMTVSDLELLPFKGLVQLPPSDYFKVKDIKEN